MVSSTWPEPSSSEAPLPLRWEVSPKDTTTHTLVPSIGLWRPLCKVQFIDIPIQSLKLFVLIFIYCYSMLFSKSKPAPKATEIGAWFTWSKDELISKIVDGSIIACLCGPNRRGDLQYFYMPTVFTNSDSHCPRSLWKERHGQEV